MISMMNIISLVGFCCAATYFWKPRSWRAFRPGFAIKVPKLRLTSTNVPQKLLERHAMSMNFRSFLNILGEWIFRIHSLKWQDALNRIHPLIIESATCSGTPSWFKVMNLKVSLNLLLPSLKHCYAMPVCSLWDLVQIFFWYVQESQLFQQFCAFSRIAWN